MKKTPKKITSDAERLLKKNEALLQSDQLKVLSHVQRPDNDWIINTLMIADIDVPFKFKRKDKYRDLSGAYVNLTYYPSSESVAGIDMEVMTVVRIRKS